jgi:hypothetical protein
MYLLLTSYSGSTATIIRIPFIWQIGSGEDFLYKNTDVSIWSTVEPGMGITASSMACLRPLFQAFLSRSRLVGSSNAGISVWNQPRNGYVKERNSRGLEVLRLESNSPKNYLGSPSPDVDLEAGAGAVQEREGSTHALTELSSWEMTKRSMTDGSFEEHRRSPCLCKGHCGAR